MRYCWIDYAKVMALFLVIMGHIVTDADTCHKLIYNFHMPFFFFLSGLLLYCVIVFSCSVLTIPIIDKTMPILIGKKRKQI